MELSNHVLLMTCSRKTNVLVIMVLRHGAKVVNLCMDLLTLVVDFTKAHLGGASLFLKGEQLNIGDGVDVLVRLAGLLGCLGHLGFSGACHY